MLTGIELLPGTTQGGAASRPGWPAASPSIRRSPTTIGTTTKFRSLELGVQATGSGTVWGYTSYRGANQPLPPDNNPANVFNRVFGQLRRPTPATLLRIQNERKSVLDAVKRELRQLNPKLGVVDKAKLDEHLDEHPRHGDAPHRHGGRWRGVREARDADDRLPAPTPTSRRSASCRWICW